MPLKKCTENGKSGWKWGDSGKCYTGPNAKKQAIKQGYAIEPEAFASSIINWDIDDLLDTIKTTSAVLIENGVSLFNRVMIETEIGKVYHEKNDISDSDTY